MLPWAAPECWWDTLRCRSETGWLLTWWTCRVRPPTETQRHRDQSAGRGHFDLCFCFMTFDKSTKWGNYQAVEMGSFCPNLSVKLKSCFGVFVLLLREKMWFNLVERGLLQPALPLQRGRGGVGTRKQRPPLSLLLFLLHPLPPATPLLSSSLLSCSRPRLWDAQVEEKGEESADAQYDQRQVLWSETTQPNKNNSIFEGVCCNTVS